MKLSLLIDTSVWLDLTKDPRHLPLLDALYAMTEAEEVELVLPQIILEEFAGSQRHPSCSRIMRLRDG